MARPRTEPAESRRRHILDAARALLVRRNYDAIVLDDVAKQAKIAKGTLYLYFRSKDHLIAAVLEDIMERLKKETSECGVPTGSPLEDLRAFAGVHLRFMEENQDFMTQILRQDPVLKRGAASPLRRAFDLHLETVSQLIAEAVRQGFLREIEPRRGALFFMTLLRMSVVRKVMLGSRQPLDG